MEFSPELPDGWAADVLRFWFSEIESAAWFKVDPELDARIGQQFKQLHSALRGHPPASLVQDARSALGAVIVLDQFSRNMFRGTAAAFAADGQARILAHLAIAGGLDLGVPARARAFFYLPLEHSEDVADQQLSVRLFQALGDPELIRYAEAHKAIVDRFGRFPHRNAPLGRSSTPAEIEFLAQPGSSF